MKNNSPFLQVDAHEEMCSMQDDVFESPPLSATGYRGLPLQEDGKSPEADQPFQWVSETHLDWYKRDMASCS